MRRIARLLLLIFCFTIPWEYSLDWGPPLGNVARAAGLALLLAAVPAILAAGRVRRFGPVQWLALAFYLWVCCTYFWTVDPESTALRIRGYVQEILPVWVIWELADSPEDLRNLLRASVAGSWVLAILTAVSLTTMETAAAEQIRFAAFGQDPNDVARFLDIGFPLAALLTTSERGWAGRLLAWGYLPVGLAGVLMTASRGGFLAAMVALAGSGAILMRRRPWTVALGAMSLPALAAMLWSVVPRGTFERLATIPEQLQGGDFNQRLNIWQQGWHAFVQAPFFGYGMGSFVVAARLAPFDTAHNTALSLAVSGGLVALLLATAIVAAAVAEAWRSGGVLRWMLMTALLVWLVSSLVATVEESRSTWLLLGIVALAGRLAAENPGALAICFGAARRERGQTADRQAA